MNPVALITGSSRGIGRGIAIELARLGRHDLVIHYASNEAAGRDCQEACRKISEGKCRIELEKHNKGTDPYLALTDHLRVAHDFAAAVALKWSIRPRALHPDGFDAQSIGTMPAIKLVRRTSALDAPMLAKVEEAVRAWSAL